LFNVVGIAGVLWQSTIIQDLLISLFSLMAVVVLRQSMEHRKRLEEVEKKSELTYRGLFESMDDAVVLLDRDTKEILDVNRAACQKYGYTREEMLMLRVTDLTADPRKTKESLESGERKVPVRYHHNKNGQLFPVEITRSEFALEERRLVV